MIDLGHELDALARAAGGDTADRLAERVRPMITRVRRRRAARGTGAVAAVAVLAVGLVVVPSWTGGPDGSGDGTAPLTAPGEADITTLACGEAVVGAVDTSPEATLTASPWVSAGRATTVSMAFPAPQATEAQSVTIVLQQPGTVVLADGVVVGRIAGEDGVGVMSWTEGSDGSARATVTGRYFSCADGSDLPAGDYEVYLWVETRLGTDHGPVDDPVTTVAGPAAVQIVGGGADDVELTTPESIDVTVLGCGQEVGRAVTATGASLSVAPFVFEGADTSLVLTYPRSRPLENWPDDVERSVRASPGSAVVADGVVVGRLEPSRRASPERGVVGDDLETRVPGVYTTCAGTGEALPAGDYEVYVWDTYLLIDETGATREQLTIAAGPARVTLVAGDAQGDLAALAEAERLEAERILARLALEQHVAMAAAAAEAGDGPAFPACLSRVPETEDPPVTAELILTGPGGGNAENVGTLRLTSDRDLTVVHPERGELAVVWDGIVVGVGPQSAGRTVEATGTTFDIPLVGTPESCLWASLPAGSYTLVGSAQVEVGAWSGRLITQTPLLTTS